MYILTPLQTFAQSSCIGDFSDSGHGVSPTRPDPDRTEHAHHTIDQNEFYQTSLYVHSSANTGV
ncbi:hypothetical protein VCV18_001851 [Metarhizium anisopliae]